VVAFASAGATAGASGGTLAVGLQATSNSNAVTAICLFIVCILKEVGRGDDPSVHGAGTCGAQAW
jgi:hypothetical protein